MSLIHDPEFLLAVVETKDEPEKKSVFSENEWEILLACKGWVELPAKVQRVLIAYVSNGYVLRDTADATNLRESTIACWLKNVDVRAIMSEYFAINAKSASVDFYDKINMLWDIALDLKTRDPKTAIQAISELNKMQGDLAAEKRITWDAHNDKDLDKLAEIMELEKKYEREF